MRSIAIISLLTLTAPAQIMINELHGGTPDWIELRNVSGVTEDLSGWVVAAYSSVSGTPALETLFVVPAGVSIPPQGHLLLQENGVPGNPGTLPCSVSLGVNLDWNVSRSIVVILWDSQLMARDYVHRRGTGGVTGAPHLPAGVAWAGDFTATGDAMVRISDQDTDNASDWTVGTASPCGPNQGQATGPAATLSFVSTGMGSLSMLVTTSPALPGVEFFGLGSTFDAQPNGTGPFFGLGWDAAATLSMPAAPGNPFHSYLDAQGRFAFSTPPGIFPSGFHLEGVVVLIEPSGALQVTPVAEVNF